ncbi:MAG: VWA domain-containing protein [Gammaproteobacteria bacterium]|nr:VWA domain-containing protein [Gammaproteobacteria bacterium]
MRNQFHVLPLVLLLLWGCSSQEGTPSEKSDASTTEQIGESIENPHALQDSFEWDINTQTSENRVSESLQFEPSRPSGMDAIEKAFETDNGNRSPIDLGKSPLEPAEESASISLDLDINLIERVFKVVSSTDIHTISVKAAENVAFSVVLIDANDTQKPPKILKQTRRTAVGLGSSTLSNLVLEPGEYKVIVRPDRNTDISINIENLATPDIGVSDTGTLNQPIEIARDVVGNFQAELFYFSLNDLDPDTIYTARLLFSDGDGQLIYTGRGGKWLTSETGTSPLIITGLLGSELVNTLLAVNFQQAAKKHPEGMWRLIIEPIQNQDLQPEIGSNSTEISDLDDGDSFSGWIDSNDRDVYSFSGNSTDKDAQPYYLNYKGPRTYIEVEQGRANYLTNGRELKLGPIGKGDFTLTLSGPTYAGRYSLTKEVIKTKGAIVVEPDALNANMFRVDDRVKGEISSSTDGDTLRFDLGERAQMWRVMVLGDSISRVSINSPFEQLASLARGAYDSRKRFPIPDLYMGPGPIDVYLSGAKGNYTVFLKPLGSPRKNDEREPNHGNFYRSLEFAQEYIGVLPAGDSDQFAFFLEKPMTISADFNLPPGASSTAWFSANGGKGLLKKSLDQDTEAFDISLPAGEILLSLSPSIPSPAEYKFRLDYKPFENISIKQVDSYSSNLKSSTEVKNIEDVQSFSLLEQTVKLPIITNLSESEKLQLWTPSTKIKLKQDQGGYGLSIKPDFETGTTPIWVARVEGEQINSVTQYQINARPDIAAVNPIQVNQVPDSMIGGLNVALAPLGAKWLDQIGYEIDQKGYLPTNNAARAASVFALNDGLRPMAGIGGYTTSLSKVANEIYVPVLDLPGEDPIPLVGVALTNRVGSNNGLKRFAVDLSMDGIEWVTALESQVISWTDRQFYEFSRKDASARYVRLRTFQENEKEPSIHLTEFEVIAKPGYSGLPGLMISDYDLGASGRIIGDGYARSFKEALFDEIGTTNRGSQGESGWTELGKTLSFKNQGIAEIEKVFIAYGTTENGIDPPKLIKLRGSVNGPAGPFHSEIELELPADFAPGFESVIELPERLVANAVNVEFSSGEQKAKQVVIPYVQLIERPESSEYLSVLGTVGEYRSRPYEPDVQDPVKALPYEGDLTPLPIDNRIFTGDVELDKNTNTWLVKPNARENTLELIVDGEPGFSPDIIVARVGEGNDEPLPPLEKKTDSLTGQEKWIFDLPSEGLEVTVSEPPRSTIFLMDQSASAAAYIARARRAVMNYADTMIPGKDRLLLRALGREWSNEEWMSDPVKVRKNLLAYQTGGNSDGEGSLLDAAERLADESGLRSIVILTDGDVGPKAELIEALAKHNIRVFVIKLSSAKMWGDPRQSIIVVQQWTELTQGELAYVLRTQDITTAYERISTRLLGPKSYTISASGSTRIIAPGTLSVIQTEDSIHSNKNSTLYHVLFDASGSMLKRRGGSRRINTAKSAIGKFVTSSLNEEQKIGLRVFGGEPDKCETELKLNPSSGTVGEFMQQIRKINPKSYARTPIAQSLAALKQDLADVQEKVQVILLSDGEETCQGDAGLVIDDLIANGLADRIDIVSFELGDSIDRTPFIDWARRGNGVYIDAQSGDELTEAFSKSVQQSFDVFQDGKVIASGIVDGEPLELSPGRYKVKIADSEKEVEIKTGAAETLMF